MSMSASPNAETLLALGRVLGAAEQHAVSSFDRKSRASLKQDVNLRFFVRTLLRNVYTTLAVRLTGDPEKAKALMAEVKVLGETEDAEAQKKAEEASKDAETPAVTPAPAA